MWRENNNLGKLKKKTEYTKKIKLVLIKETTDEIRNILRKRWHTKMYKEDLEEQNVYRI